MMTRLSLPLLLFAGTLMGTACGGSFDSTWDGPPWPASCRSDIDCEPMQGCFKAAGICVTRYPAGSALTFSVQPNGRLDTPGDQFNGIYMSAPGTLDLQLVPAAIAQGRLGRQEEDEGIEIAPDPGRLVATAEGLIPGLQFRCESGHLDEKNAFAWELALIPDLDYLVTFVPDKRTVPPWHFRLNIGLSGSVQFDLPPKSSISKVRGIVVGSEDGGKFPVGNSIVTALIDGKLVSSSVTDDLGVFDVSVPNLPGQIRIVVAPGESGKVFADREFKWDSIDDFRQALPSTDFLVLDVGSLPVVASISLYVVGLRETAVRVPVAGTRLFIHGDGPDGTYRMHTTVDETSVKLLKLPPGDYRIDAVTPGYGLSSRLRAAQYSMGQRAFSFQDGQSGNFAVELPPRPRISGRIVYSGTDDPIRDARIVFASTAAELLPLETPTDADVVHEAMSDSRGEFLVRLDPGNYAVRVEPFSGSGLAPASWRLVTITGTENIQISVTSGRMLEGTVRSADGKPLEKALITFFFPTTFEQYEQWPMKTSSISRTIREAGRAITDSNGRFQVILPDPDNPAAAIGAIFTSWSDGQ
ncbi:MAG TPA: carboxypeptidase-like regulatory domain-containing protein [Myxococcota bacterium]|nr:carboxypeptidase-like regulatory domain-containing protein [Myxococcota bacterium]